MQIAVVPRGCGDPQGGGLYGYIPTGPNGIPPEEFLIDYPQPIPDGLNIKPRGLTQIEVGGIVHVVDHIGVNNYPNFPDWFEELCRFGFHQRVERSFNFHALDPLNSKYLMVHPRGLLSRMRDVAWLLDNQQHHDLMRYDFCPINQHEIDWRLESELHGMCIGLLWQALTKGKKVGKDRLIKRTMPSFEYYGFETDKKLKWEPAFVAAFPIKMMRWLVYKGQGGEETETLQKLESAPEWLQPIVVEAA